MWGFFAILEGEQTENKEVSSKEVGAKCLASARWRGAQCPEAVHKILSWRIQPCSASSLAWLAEAGHFAPTSYEFTPLFLLLGEVELFELEGAELFELTYVELEVVGCHVLLE